jgi:hypothetical protein
MFSRVLLTVAAAGISFAARAEEATSDPEALVRELMRLELWSVASPEAGEDQPFSETSLDRFFTPEFAEAYRAVMDRQQQRNEPLIDGDLILDSQEYCPPIEIDLDHLGVGGSTAIIQVNFRTQWCWSDVPADVTERVDSVQFHLVHGEGGWRIADFDVATGSTVELFATLMRD